jgi:hypothetical protein
VNLSGLGITAKLDLVPGRPRATLTAHLKLDPDALSIKESAAGWTGKIQELFLELNHDGREVGRFSDTKQFQFAASHKQKYDVEGVILSTPFQLAPEAATLSIVVRDIASGRTGSLIIRMDKLTSQPPAR